MGSRIDLLFGQPPAKKQFVEREDHHAAGAGPGSPLKARTMVAPQVSVDSRMFSRKSHASQLTPFEKKLMAVREQKDSGAAQASRNPRYDKVSAEKLDNIRQWQRHYRKAFPSFVFYFDSLPADVRNRSLREVLALGAVSAFSLFILYLLLFETSTNLDTARGEILLSHSHPCCHLSSHPRSRYSESD